MAKLDTNIIVLHSENSRQMITYTGRVLKKSPQRLKYSMSVLLKDKILYDPHCIFDYSYFGLILFRVYFKGGYVGEKDKSAIIGKLTKNDYIVSVCELSGEYDLVVEMISPNPSRFNKEIKKMINEIPSLNNYNVILNLVSHIYPAAYLIKNQNLFESINPEIIIGGDRNVESLKEHELSIIRSLLYNPQIRMTKLAKETSLNIKTVSSLFNLLKKKKIIRSFKYSINIDSMDIHMIRLFLKLHNLSKEREDQLMLYLIKTKEIVQLNKTVGDWDMEIDIQSLRPETIRGIILELRQNFKDIISGFNRIEVYSYYKRSFLPKYIFDQR